MPGHLPEVVDFGKKHGLSDEALKELQGLMVASIHLTQKRVTVEVPASVANLGPGIETCGLAVDIWDEFTLEYAESFGMEVYGDTAGEIPRTHENLVVLGASCAYKAAGLPFPPLRFSCTHRIPFSKGLGAASASFVGGFLAASVLCSEEFSSCSAHGVNIQEKLKASGSFVDVSSSASHMVKKIQSTGHDGGSGSSSVTPDGEPQEGHDIAVHGLLQTAIQQGSNAGNVCPAIYGALQIATETPSGWRSHRVPVPTGLVCVIFVPEGLQEGKPLPQQPVDRKAAIFNVGRVALLVNCFCTKNFAMFQKATEDTLSQPHCHTNFPHLAPVIQAAMDAGATGACPSGYGPSVMALITGRSGDVLAQSASNQLERDVAEAMLDKADELGLNGSVLIAKPADVGAHVLARKSEIGGAHTNDRIVYFQ